MNRKWIFGTMALLAFLGASITIYEVKTYRIDRPIELRLDISGIKEAQAAENAWGGVRQSVTWANANSSLIDSILTGLNSANFFQWPDDTTVARVNVQLGTFTGKIHITKNATSTYNVTCSACGSAKGFKHRLIIWRQSDDAKALELFFNDYGDVSGSGALVIYRTNVLNPTQFNGNDTFVESWVQSGSDGNIQTYTWSNGPLSSGGPTNKARIFLETMASGTLLCVQGVIRLNSTAATEFRDAAPLAGCNAAQNLYYVIGYGQKIASPFQTTAKVAMWDGDNFGQDGRICDISHGLNYGLFNGNGFINDGVASSSVPSDFRSGSAIDTLFAEIGTSTGNSYDDMQQATIDGLNVTFLDPGSTLAPSSDSGP